VARLTAAALYFVWVDKAEFDKLVGRIDAEIQDTRKNVEMARRREDLERRAKELREQIEALQKRRTMLVQLGRFDLVREIDPVLAVQQKEAADIRAALMEYGPPPTSEEALKVALGSPRAEPGAPAQPLKPEDRAEAMLLIDEIEAGKGMMADWAQEERGVQLRIFALRWRALAERIGQGIARGDPAMRKAYAVIMETRERYPGLPFIEALDPRRHGEWSKELEAAKKELVVVRERVRRQREAGASKPREGA